MKESTHHLVRNKLHYTYLILLTIGLGLFSRTQYIPISIYFILGDILYALLIFFILGFLFERASTSVLAGTAFVTCFLIELSQLYQAPWILFIRETTLGGLILGHGFLWSDVIAYAIGTIIGGLIEWGNLK